MSPLTILSPWGYVAAGVIVVATFGAGVATGWRFGFDKADLGRIKVEGVMLNERANAMQAALVAQADVKVKTERWAREREGYINEFIQAQERERAVIVSRNAVERRLRDLTAVKLAEARRRAATYDPAASGAGARDDNTADVFADLFGRCRAALVGMGDIATERGAKRQLCERSGDSVAAP